MSGLIILIITIIAGVSFLVANDQENSVNDTIESSSTNYVEENIGENKNYGILSSQDDSFEDWNSNTDEEVDLSEIEDRTVRAEDLRSNIENLNYEIGRLRRNTDSYDADEFASKLRRLQYEADDLSSDADDLEAEDVTSSLDETSYGLRKLKNDIESEPSYFYRDREDEVDSRLKQSEYITDDALSGVDDFSSDLSSFE